MYKIDTKHKLNSALIGMILFDGSMNTEKTLYIRHGGKQLSYVDEKVNYISKYLTPVSIRSSVDKAGYAYKYAYYNDKRLTTLYKKIYSSGKKSLAKVIHRFDAITLAIMYMDDGCLGLRKDPKNPSIYKSREIHIMTHCFPIGEVQMLVGLLKNKFGVEFHITKDRGLPRIWCNTKNTIKFLEIVAPIIREYFPTLHYKLDLKYKVKNISFL